MAVYQGARLAPRLRPAGLPVGAAPRTPDDREASRRSLPRPARPRPAGVIMGAILGLTMLALVYLTQTLGSHAATAQMAKLEVDRAKVARTLANQAAVIEVKTDPVHVGHLAQRAGLVELGDPVILRAP